MTGAEAGGARGRGRNEKWLQQSTGLKASRIQGLRDGTVRRPPLSKNFAARGLAQVAVAAAFALAFKKERSENIIAPRNCPTYYYYLSRNSTSDLRSLLLFPVHAEAPRQCCGRPYGPAVP